MKTTAPAPAAITLRVAPVADLAAQQAEAECDAVALVEGVHVECDDDYTVADTLLTNVVRRKDAAEHMRKEVTGPLNTALRNANAWFAPLRRALETCEAHLKREMGAYRVAKAERERQARDDARDALVAGDPVVTVVALTAADEAAVAPAGRATTRWRWVVKRIAEDLLPSEWWVPDHARIEAYARAWGNEDEPPVISGVVFERTATIGARR